MAVTFYNIQCSTNLELMLDCKTESIQLHYDTEAFVINSKLRSWWTLS